MVEIFLCHSGNILSHIFEHNSTKSNQVENFVLMAHRATLLV